MTSLAWMADDVRNHKTMPCFSAADRRLRDLATMYKIRRRALWAYEYRDGMYFFREGFRKFCSEYFRNQKNRNNGK